MISRLLAACRAATLVCLFALAWVGQTHAAGFDERYEARVGDSDGDGLADDLYIRQKPRVILIDVGDVATPIVTPGDVSEFVLEYGGSAFTLRTNLSRAQKNQYQGWPIANVEVTLGDLNADAVPDLVIKGINALPGLSTALDQIVFASTTARKAPPVHVKGIDENVRRFFRDLNGHSENINYYYQTAIRNHWYHINEGPELFTYWSIAYLHYYGFTWNNGAIRALDSDLGDIFDQNATPELCTHFLCRWTTDRWYVQAWGRDLELVLHYENFSASARGLEGTLNSLVAGGGVECGSTNAVNVANAVQGVIGTQVWGGALANCSVLPREAVFSAVDLAKARLGALYLYLKAAAIAVQPKADPGDPVDNQADLEAALTYLKQSATFRALWAEFEKLNMKIIVHRNAADQFDPMKPKQIIWDPDGGMVMQAGIASPASGLAHEIAHAVKFHANPQQYMIEMEPRPGQGNDPYEPNTVYVTRRAPIEEERATAVERAIQAELGEPQRVSYTDGDPDAILVTGPTYKCFRGNPTCDNLIEDWEDQ